MIEELLNSSRDVIDSDSGAVIVSIVKKQFPGLSGNLFVVDRISEQSEDIITILVNGNQVCKIEVPRGRHVGADIHFEYLPLEEYLRSNPRLTKVTRRKLEMAVLLFSSLS